MKTINVNHKLRNFLSKIEEKNMKIHKEHSSKIKDEKYNNFEFKVKHLLVFDKSGFLLINSSIADYAQLSPKFIDAIKLFIMKVICLDLKYFEIFFKHNKIFILNKNLIYLVILANKYNSCLVRLYLLFMNTVFINLLGENILNQIYVDFSNISKILEVYYIPPLTTKFSRIIEYIISKKEANSSKYLYKFKNLFIYYVENNGYIIPLFDYRKITHNKELKYKYNIRQNEKILNHITKLILEPIYNNNYINKTDIYSHSLELFATFPRLMLLGKYLKILDGINFVQIYSAKKLSKITVNYQEYEEKQQLSMDDYYKIASKHSNKFLKLIEFFLYNYFETITDIMNRYCNPKNELLYFDIDLLIVTNDVISLKVADDTLVNLVFKRLQLTRMKLGKEKHSILFEEKSETSNSNSSENSNKKNNKDNNNNKYNSIAIKKENNNSVSEISKSNRDSSSLSITSVSKTFLQIDTSDVFRELKRKSIQFSSFDSNALYDGQSEISEIWNISCINNSNQNNNNYDLRSLFSNIPGDKKFSGIDTLSFLEKQEKNNNNNISRRQTEKQINIFKGHRNSIGPTFNIIVNNNNSNNNNKEISNKDNRKVSMRSIKNKRYHSILIGGNKNATPSPNKMNYNKNLKNAKNSSFNITRSSNLFKRSHSSTMSGLYLNQFYSLINNNPKYFKTKYQIIKEIQNKIKQSYTKKSNSLIIEQKENKENKEQNKINNLNLNQPLSDDDDIQENKKDIIQEYYEDKSSTNFLQNNNDNNNSIFKKLNEK